MSNIFSDRVYKILIENALVTLFDKDERIISHKVKEEAINHRLAVYIENIIQKDEKYVDLRHLNIDIEYDKSLDNDKKSITDENGEKINIRPDILIHKRGNHSRNEVIIECKIEALTKKDRNKLIKLKKPPYRYRNCFALVYKPKKDYFFFYYVIGEEIKKLKVSKNEINLEAIS